MFHKRSFERDTLNWDNRAFSGGNMNFLKQVASIFIMALVTLSLSAVASKCEVRSGANRGWVYTGDSAYYYDDEGMEYTGMNVMPDDGTTRYFDPESHVMVKGEVEIDGNKYYFDETGVMATGFQNVDGNTRYYGTDTGIMKTGWVESGPGKFYFDPENGNMVTGWQDIGGNRYYFADDGSVVKGAFELEGNKYYSDPSSGILTRGCVSIDGKQYYYDKDTGVLTTGWVEIDGEKYYFDETTGAGYDGIIELEGSTYGFVGGMMLKNKRAMGNNHLYYFGEDGSVVRDIDGDKPMVALTYDDGPSIYTDQILDVYEQYGARCTFFLVGDRISWNEEQAIREFELGCEQGNHTYSHNRLTDLDGDGMVEVLNGTDEELIRISGKPSTCLRPPEGRYNDTLKEVCNAPIILWSVDSEDWKSRNADTVCSRIIGKVKDGDIVLMHDLYQSTADATERIVPALLDAGFQLVTVEEMGLLRLDGGLENGVVYYSIP